MKSLNQNRIRPHVASLSLAAMLMLAATFAIAQTAPATARFVGTLTAISGDTITVKTDAGEIKQVTVPSSATLQRVEPGQKSLSGATTIQLSDLETGDRVLVRINPDATGPTPEAAQIVTIKAADVAQKQQQEREEWARNGVGGLVKSVDIGAGAIVIASGAGPTAKTVTVHVSPSTVLKRYAPASVRFDLAQPAPIDQIHPGDQLRARGTKNADGTAIDAAEVVSGSFRNISGTISSLDASNSTIVVKDLATKKQVSIHIPADTQMHALPEMMARMIAARLKGGAAGEPHGPAGAPQPSGGAPPAGAPQHNWNGAGGGNGQFGQGRRGGAGGAGDMQQVLNRAPVIQFSDLKKGEAIMLVSTAGNTDLTAIALLTGVEPLLEAPEASQNLLSNWSMGGGGGADAAAAQ